MTNLFDASSQGEVKKTLASYRLGRRLDAKESTQSGCALTKADLQAAMALIEESLRAAKLAFRRAAEARRAAERARAQGDALAHAAHQEAIQVADQEAGTATSRAWELARSLQEQAMRDLDAAKKAELAAQNESEVMKAAARQRTAEAQQALDNATKTVLDVQQMMAQISRPVDAKLEVLPLQQEPSILPVQKTNLEGIHAEPLQQSAGALTSNEGVDQVDNSHLPGSQRAWNWEWQRAKRNATNPFPCHSQDAHEWDRYSPAPRVNSFEFHELEHFRPPRPGSLDEFDGVGARMQWQYEAMQAFTRHRLGLTHPPNPTNPTDPIEPTNPVNPTDPIDAPEPITDGAMTAPNRVGLYESFVVELEMPDFVGSEAEKFAAFPELIFRQGDRQIKVDGYYDGDNTWRARFLPSQQGTWDFSWSFDGQSGTKSFEVTENTNPLNHGHVNRSGRYLQTDDGDGFHYRGANWVNISHLRPNPGFGGMEAEGDMHFFQDGEWEAYMARLSETGHNGNYFTGMERLMNNDRKSFNLEWAQRLDAALEVAGKNGIYTFLNIFNTWGRSARSPHQWDADAGDQLLNPWDVNTNTEATDLLLRYLTARYAGHYNVMWELGNEMEHSPNDGGAFVRAANSTYIPALRRYDPYDLPITLSEGIWKNTDVDIGGNHHMQGDSGSDRPIIFTELVGGNAMLWDNRRYTDPAYRPHYRHAFWNSFASGGSGSIEASHLFGSGQFSGLTDFLRDPNIRAVMDDHARLTSFLEQVTTPLYELQPAQRIGASRAPYLAIGKPGQEYVAYWSGQHTPPSLDLDLPAGDYRARWYSPMTGAFTPFQPVATGETISAPAQLSSDDFVLQVVRA